MLLIHVHLEATFQEASEILWQLEISKLILIPGILEDHSTLLAIEHIGYFVGHEFATILASGRSGSSVSKIGSSCLFTGPAHFLRCYGRSLFGFSFDFVLFYYITFLFLFLTFSPIL